MQQLQQAPGRTSREGNGYSLLQVQGQERSGMMTHFWTNNISTLYQAVKRLSKETLPMLLL